VLQTPGKAAYNSLCSFRIIVLRRTISKILTGVLTVRLSTLGRSKRQLQPIHCSSLPGLCFSAACLALTHEVRTLQRPRLKISTLFFDIKAGFDNVNPSALRARPLATHIPPYMVDCVSSFLMEGTCTLVFPGSPNLPSPVSVATPPGSPISPLLFLLYITPLDMSHQQNVKTSPGPPRGVMVPLVLLVHPDPPWSTLIHPGPHFR